MESKRKIVNGETVCECEFSVDELDMIYNALNRLWCHLDEKRVEAGDSPEAEFYDEECEKISTLFYKVDSILVP